MKIGDKVVYRKWKHSKHPSPKSTCVYPAEHGDDYDYAVDKYWLFLREDKGNIVCRTRTGKEVIVHSEDSNLRKANIIERIFRKDRFPS